MWEVHPASQQCTFITTQHPLPVSSSLIPGQHCHAYCTRTVLSAISPETAGIVILWEGSRVDLFSVSNFITAQTLLYSAMVNLLQWLFHVIPRFPTPLLEPPANIVVIFLFIRKSQDTCWRDLMQFHLLYINVSW